MGEEWLTFMQKANNVMLWWQMLDWVEEVWRRLLDALVMVRINDVPASTPPHSGC